MLPRLSCFCLQVNDGLEVLLRQLQAHNNPHVGAVQAAMNLASGSVAPNQVNLSSQVSHSTQVHHSSAKHCQCKSQGKAAAQHIMPADRSSVLNQVCPGGQDACHSWHSNRTAVRAYNMSFAVHLTVLLLTIDLWALRRFVPTLSIFLEAPSVLLTMLVLRRTSLRRHCWFFTGGAGVGKSVVINFIMNCS